MITFHCQSSKNQSRRMTRFHDDLIKPVDCEDLFGGDPDSDTGDFEGFYKCYINYQ